ncbi:PHP domain-containing protein [Paenarthrobacter nitroguajacolicus]|jgi:putative hydrolase|uniref:PHP domain-containing protein n=1 Tax=Paenarthrobacter nitroguajacolicus TaxID=211146 RepID=UPI0015C04681|nr:PHP domain-containing protein [Paenarthrobacter nitroguajacolicus]NWL12827.1 PHP domain-containing protein [Paenarthrobacter nitroguajacolicus]NWL34829.1 PHP domain-containing protein [Paenarthrobacter nitroguajacolicus]
MDPIEALDEISFWLERSQAPTFKVQAFRKAADAVRQLAPEDLATLVSSGRITSLKGVGSRSAEVITQAMEDRTPDYLADLRERGTESLAAGGDTLRAALRGDLHSHSNWSDGGSPIETMVAAARTLGREYLALTDHSPNLTIANGLSVERLEKQLGVVEGINAAQDGFRLLKGIEVDILEDGTLDQTPDMLDRLDVVVASVHSKLRSDKKTMTTRMLGGISDPHTNVLGHCTGRLVQGSRGTRPESEFDAAKVFKECAEWGVAVEINSRPERQDPPDNLIRMALDAGCLFSIDSDAHAPGQLDFLQYGAERAEALGVPKERIVTTWPLEQLKEWLSLKK